MTVITLAGLSFTAQAQADLKVTLDQINALRAEPEKAGELLNKFMTDAFPDEQMRQDTLKDKYGDKMPSLITFATGPSRTADIEKTLVVGVHGPKEVYCFLVEA